MACELPTAVRIAIIGSGFSGLAMAIRLKQEGIDDFVVLERADELGGTWRDNTYPGCSCDVPSHLYSFSFEPNPSWSSTFSPQPEIQDYLRRCADKYGVAPHLRFGHEVTEAAWDDKAARWHVQTAGGDFSAQMLVSGMGFLNEPSIPALPGLDDFEGAVFHSATWKHDHDLSGERVAAIGTGASAIQFIPEIQPRVARLYVFQRSAPWIMPRPARPLTSLERRLYRALPQAQLLMRAAIYWARETFILPFIHHRLSTLPQRIAQPHLEKQVADPRLRAKLTPTYAIGCKRILISDDYYPALQQPNVELVTDGIREVRPRSIVTQDGGECEVDTIVFGTGFHVADTPAAQRLRGKDGRLLSDVWNNSPEAYVGTAIAGYPNLFMLVGPNTGLGHNSMVFMIESQVSYVMQCLRAMEERAIATVEVRPEVQAAFNAKLQADTQDTVWLSGCRSWYLDDEGVNRALWPGFSWTYRQRIRRFDAHDYSLRPGAAQRNAAPA